MFFDRVYVVAAVALIFGFITLIVWNVNARERSADNWETYTSLLHLQVLKCLEASHCGNAFIGLTKITEARVGVELLCRLTGGESELKRISGIDVVHLNNTITFYERQFRAHPSFKHPLQSLASETNKEMLQ